MPKGTPNIYRMYTNEKATKIRKKRPNNQGPSQSTSTWTYPNGWDANMAVRWSYRCYWKATSQDCHLFSQFTSFVVGNGDGIQFQEYLWWGVQPLYLQYLGLYRVISVTNLTILVVLFGSSFNLEPKFSMQIQILKLNTSRDSCSLIFIIHRFVYSQKIFLVFIFTHSTPILFHLAIFYGVQSWID